MKSDEENIVKSLTEYILEINGKSTNKEEFVTCGGINLKEINFKTMESKKRAIYFLPGNASISMVSRVALIFKLHGPLLELQQPKWRIK